MTGGASDTSIIKRAMNGERNSGEGSVGHRCYEGEMAGALILEGEVRAKEDRREVNNAKDN